MAKNIGAHGLKSFHLCMQARECSHHASARTEFAAVQSIILSRGKADETRVFVAGAPCRRTPSVSSVSVPSVSTGAANFAGAGPVRRTVWVSCRVGLRNDV